MKRLRLTLPLLLTALLAFPLTACDDDDGDDGMEPPEESYTLTFAGDASFNGAHGGQTIYVAVVRTSTGSVVAERTGTVSANDDPAFSFTFTNALDQGAEYEVHYWIDSNFMGGGAGVCDGPDDDHQWRVVVGTATDDVTITDTHRPGETESVCSTF